MLRFHETSWRRLLIAPGILAGALVVLALSLSLAGYDAVSALAAMWRGSFGSADAFFSSTLVRATPLMLAGLGVGLAFRAGIWNIGAEGQMIVGGAAAAAVGLAFTNAPRLTTLPLVVAAAAASGVVWAYIADLLRRRRGVLEVISTIMLNFVALHLVGFLVHGPLQEPLGIYPQSETIAEAARLPRLLSGTRLHAGFVIAILASPLLWWWLRHTASGFRVRAVGASPQAAAMAGRINVARVTGGAFLLSGALAGLAGGVEVSGVTYALYDNLAAGTGYTAIVVALLGRLDPLGIAASAILFGALESGALAMQRDAGVPSVVVTVIEAVLVLALLVADRRRWMAPNDRAATARGGPAAMSAKAAAVSGGQS